MANKKANGARIRALREARMWSQEQLSEVSGVGLRTVQRAEQGEALSCETLKALGALFKVDAEELVAREAPRPDLSVAETELIVLPQLTSASQLTTLVQGHGFLFMNDEPKTPEETDALAAFFDYLRDWGDICRDLGPGEQLRSAEALKQQLKELESRRFLAFGLIKAKVMRISGGTPFRWNVAHVVIAREDNPSIVKSAGEETPARLPALFPVNTLVS